ncbi:unnamed protein product, partial [Musa textilis]
MIFVWVLKDASFEEKVSCFLGKETEKADSRDQIDFLLGAVPCRLAWIKPKHAFMTKQP